MQAPQNWVFERGEAAITQQFEGHRSVVVRCRLQACRPSPLFPRDVFVVSEASDRAARVNHGDAEQRRAAAFPRAQRRETLLGIVWLGLEHFLEAGEIAHAMVAEAGQSNVASECGLSESSSGARQQRLAAVRGRS
jgi:hypothetical protein